MHIDSPTVEMIIQELTRHPVNSNRFFRSFENEYLDLPQLQSFLRQYHYFCKRFVKLLEGLLYKTPLDEIEMRIELTKTLYSELGSGSSERAHVKQLERFARALGLTERDLAQTQALPEVDRYLRVLERLFMNSDYLVALGAEMAVETTAASEFRYLYPGLQKYEQFSPKDLEFFELHVREEQQHSDWLVEAVRKTAKTQEELTRVAAGAQETADAWHDFWQGLDREIFHHSPRPS
ncbi:MAG: TenA family transcriptional regulator [Nitrospiraceae bacterium]